MIKKTYKYNDTEYTNVTAVRTAIWETERVAFGTPETAEQWAELGVEYTETTVEDPAPDINMIRNQKLRELDNQFEHWYTEDATLYSTLGFEADSDQRAMMDINGLVILGQGAIFMDAQNQPHELTIEKLEVLQKEVIAAGTAAYAVKWAYRTKINEATTVDELNDIFIRFEPYDANKALEQQDSTESSKE